MLEQSILGLISMQSSQKRLDNFAKERYNEKYPREKHNYDQVWHHYVSFKIVDKNTIVVLFNYGQGDYDFKGSFDIDMRPYYREEKINLLDLEI